MGGRKISDTLFSVCRFGVNLEWPNLSGYTGGDQTAQKDNTGFRAFIINNSRFHSVGVGAIINNKCWRS